MQARGGGEPKKRRDRRVTLTQDVRDFVVISGEITFSLPREGEINAYSTRLGAVGWTHTMTGKIGEPRRSHPA
jgi:hypothetical protein